jgi:Leucine-rich repeat (LRR) protein
MVAIKESKGAAAGQQSGAADAAEELMAGHEAFETARVVDTFNPRSTEYSGKPTENLWKLIAAGGLSKVVLDNATLTDAQLVLLVNAMASTQCRVKTLSLQACKGATTIPAGLWVHVQASSMKGADELDLSDWNDLQTLPEGLGELTQLKTLTLAYCRNLQTLPDTIGACVNLTDLNLESCEKLTTIGFVGKLIKLKTLDLQFCDALETLPDALGACTDLESLDLDHCVTLQTLPDALGKLVRLERLDLSGCKTLLPPQALGKVLNLPTFSRSGQATALPQSNSQLTKLTSLSLVACVNLETLPASILAGLVNLKRLRLQGCKKLQPMPSVRQLVNLKTLDLSVDWLDSDNLQTLPASVIGELINLEDLNLNHCKKLTTLPLSITQLTKLNVFFFEIC